MKKLAIICILSISLTSFAHTTDVLGCNVAQNERIENISSLRLSVNQREDVLRLCLNSNSYYWFSSELYISARNAGDNHETALAEYQLYADLDYTINKYKQMRSILSGQSVSIEYRRALLQQL